MNELVLTEELKGLPESKAKMIKDTFDPMVKMLESFEGEFNRVSEMEQTEERSTEAKKLRLAIARVRIDADKVRKEQKEEYLRAGNAIQGVYNILKLAVGEMEDKLKEIETYYERIEAEKIARIQAERESELMKYEADSAGLDLGKMPETVWSTYLSGVKSNYEVAMEAERKAEAERIERERKEKLYQSRRNELAKYAQFGAFDRLSLEMPDMEYATLQAELENEKQKYDKSQEEIRKENERLKAEAEKKEAERKKAEEKAAKEQQAKEAELQKEREQRAKLEKEQREKEERERKEAQAKAEAEKKAAQAPDKEKLLNYSTELLSRLNSVQSPEAKQAIQEASYILSSAAERM